MDVTRQVVAALESALGVPGRLRNATASTPLLGVLPELDSMAVVGVITTLQERLGVEIDDDEIDGSAFATVGALVQLVERKLRVGVND
jgi:acyl carrier protein